MSQERLQREYKPFPRIHPVRLFHLFQGYLSQILKAFKKTLLLVLSLYFTAHFSHEQSLVLEGCGVCLKTKSYSGKFYEYLLRQTGGSIKSVRLFPYMLYEVKAIPQG